MRGAARKGDSPPKSGESKRKFVLRPWKYPPSLASTHREGKVRDRGSAQFLRCEETLLIPDDSIGQDLFPVPKTVVAKIANDTEDIRVVCWFDASSCRRMTIFTDAGEPPSYRSGTYVHRRRLTPPRERLGSFASAFATVSSRSLPKVLVA